MTNWREYDAALRARGSLTVWFSDEAIEAWRAEPRTTRGGQPRYSALAIATALTLRAVFRLALRQTEGLIGSILHLLDLDLATPDHSTLSRRAETPQVARPRRAPNARPVHLLVDSTGLRLCGPGDWLMEKHGSRKRRSWKKLHLATDADTGRIAASVLTAPDADDGSQVGPLLERIDGPVASLTADGAFDRDDVYAEVAAASRRKRRRATPIQRGSERHSRDVPHATRPAHRDDRRARPDGVAEAVRLQLACLRVAAVNLLAVLVGKQLVQQRQIVVARDGEVMLQPDLGQPGREITTDGAHGRPLGFLPCGNRVMDSGG